MHGGHKEADHAICLEQAPIEERKKKRNSKWKTEHRTNKDNIYLKKEKIGKEAI